MPEYVLGHGLKGERARLALMSKLLDPMHRRSIDALDVVRRGARALEVGNGVHFRVARRTSEPWWNSGRGRSGFLANRRPRAEP